MMKRTIIFAVLILAAGAVNAQSANKRSKATASRQVAPLAATADVNATVNNGKTITANASVNSVGVNATAPAIAVQERPATNGVKTPKVVEGKNVSESKANEKQK